MSYKRIPNTAGGNSYKDIRVFESITTNYLEASLLNYELEEVLLAIKRVFNIDLEVIKKEPRNE